MGGPSSGGTDLTYGVAVGMFLGDSITYGNASDLICGFREPIFYKAIAENKPIRFVGPFQYAGVHNTLSRDPFMAAVPGQVLNPTGIDNMIYFNIYGVNVAVVLEGTNDIFRGDDAATVLASISLGLDTAWANRTSSKFQIVWMEILKRGDALDSVVQAVNAGIPAIIAAKSYRANVTLALTYAAVTPFTIGVTMFDDVHPLDPGYQLIANVAWPYIRTALMQFLS